MNRETYNLIENITDPAIFEQLVTDLLIVYDSKFLRLNNTGINNNGKTRKAPIDTSGVILENNKQHHYYIENTITELKSLRNKWLNEKETSKNPLGDLIKAINKVKSDKKDFPNDNFTIYLTSNRRKDDNLDKEVRKKAKDENVQVDILWQEFWVQILDNNPDGQYIRNKYFKIPQERLSLNLLNKISNNLLEAYSINLLNTIDNLEKSIERDEFFEIFDSFVNTSNKLTILAGTSGSGKSNICYQILKKIINENKYALWLKPQYLSNADCIEDAIDVVIKKYCSDSLRNFNSNLNCLYIVIDDINSTSNPQKMLKTIMSLVQKDKLYGVFDYKIICPVWLELIDLDNNDFKNTNYISIGKMSKRNAIQALRIFHTNLSDIQLDDVAYNLDYDPYLIGLFNQLENISNSELIEISKNIQFEFLKNIIEDICSINSAFLYHEYIDNLFRMSINLLKSRNFLPKISDIQEMKDVDFSCLRIIIQNKKFIREDKKGNIIFRHDRARDYLFSLALCDAFKRGNIDENIITDPYYSKIVGYALAHSDVNKEILEIVEQKNPLAIIESINYIKNINETYLEQTIWNTIEEHYIKISNINSLYNAINYALINIENNDFVLIMRNKYSQKLYGWAHYGWLLLDFKYGNLFSGAIYCEKFKSIECNYQFFNDLVNHVKLKYTNSIKDKIIELLSDFDSVYKKGILILVGCFNIYDEEICKSVSKFWHQETNKQELLLYYTWAILNSFDLENYKILNDILLEYLNVSTQKDKHGNSKLGSYIDIYRMAYSYNTHFLSDNALRALIKLVGNSSIFKKWLAWGVHCIDNIIAIEYCINYLVELNKIHPDNTFNYNITDHWDKRLNRGNLSSKTRLWLYGEWNSNKQIKYRQIAFKYWCVSADINDLKDIQQISKLSPFYKKALIKRMELCDKTVVSEYIENIIKKQDYHHFYKEVNIWNTELNNFLDLYIKKRKRDVKFDVIFALMMIDKKDAEKLIIKNKEILQDNIYIALAELHIGTKEMLNLANQYFSKPHVDLKAQQIILMPDSSKDNSKIYSMKFLENIMPNVDKFNEDFLVFLANQYSKHTDIKSKNINLWNNLINNLSKEKQKDFLPKNKDEIVNFINKYSNSKDISFLLLEIRDFSTKEKMILLNYLVEWFTTNNSFENLKIIAKIVQNFGNRKCFEEILIPCKEQFIMKFGSSYNNLLVSNHILMDAKYYLFSRTLN